MTGGLAFANSPVPKLLAPWPHDEGRRRKTEGERPPDGGTARQERKGEKNV